MKDGSDVERRYPICTPLCITSIKQLKKESEIEDGDTFFILLNFGVRSSKRIEWDEPSQSFCIVNEVDGTHQDLTEAELFTKSNIGEAIRKGALFKY